MVSEDAHRARTFSEGGRRGSFSGTTSPDGIVRIPHGLGQRPKVTSVAVLSEFPVRLSVVVHEASDQCLTVCVLRNETVPVPSLWDRLRRRDRRPYPFGSNPVVVWWSVA